MTVRVSERPRQRWSCQVSSTLKISRRRICSSTEESLRVAASSSQEDFGNFGVDVNSNSNSRENSKDKDERRKEKRDTAVAENKQAFTDDL